MARQIRARRSGRREPAFAVLVTTEGLTEKRYLEDVRAHLRLPLEVRSDCRSDPRSVVNRAVELNGGRAFGASGSRYDEGWAVFDRDTHENYDEAGQIAERKNLQLARSNLCFEVWILIHFVYSTRAWSSSESLLEVIREQLPDYAKNRPCTPSLLQRLEAASANARKLRLHHQTTGSNGNPSTEMDRLVERLHALAGARR